MERDVPPTSSLGKVLRWDRPLDAVSAFQCCYWWFCCWLKTLQCDRAFVKKSYPYVQVWRRSQDCPHCRPHSGVQKTIPWFKLAILSLQNGGQKNILLNPEVWLAGWCLTERLAPPKCVMPSVFSNKLLTKFKENDRVTTWWADCKLSHQAHLRIGCCLKGVYFH